MEREEKEKSSNLHIAALMWVNHGENHDPSISQPPTHTSGTQLCVCVVYVSMRLLRRCECAHFLFVCCTHSQFYLLQYSTVYSTLTYTVKVCVCVCVLPCSCACCEYLSVW